MKTIHITNTNKRTKKQNDKRIDKSNATAKNQANETTNNQDNSKNYELQKLFFNCVIPLERKGEILIKENYIYMSKEVFKQDIKSILKHSKNLCKTNVDTNKESTEGWSKKEQDEFNNLIN